MRLAIFAAWAACSIVAPASAATTLSSVSADFSDPVGGNSSFYHYLDTDGRPGSEEIRWGDPGSPNRVDRQSGLRFSYAPAQAIVQGTPFTLGTLTYYNNPVLDAINAVSFSVSPGLTVDGAPLATGPFTFLISVDETPNQNNPATCPYPSNIGCSDKISIKTGAATQVFQLGDQTLTLYIDGFLDAQLVPQSSFIAQEQESTTATLVAHFDLASPVPEPASWAMLVAGFGILGGAMRRSGSRIRFKTVRSPV
ncbi:PEP-CTERM sorting domain-containing protein [Sphingomonas sp. AP4-R1]|uniref:THxN family PEP-CTERM protein n=1 Tax=Sphingomonas sp. AP4-R1 TaxID=2735134 RepID=UPI0014933760|nr:THxN family PEP-CTERM protein [Sphingomonas sp. AP4-R1]QJU56647.1 PEP-CTERM sorting domain-containing protein [Sphingomonas sp. AP4-R1]